MADHSSNKNNIEVINDSKANNKLRNGKVSISINRWKIRRI